MQPKRYNKKMRIMHWVLSPLIILMLGVGLYMTSQFVPQDIRFFIYSLHKSTGLLILLLVILRIIIRMRSAVPAPDARISQLEQKLAKAGHHIIYLLLCLVPISGYLMSDLAGYPVQFFGLAIPSMFATNQNLADFAHTSHTIFNYTLIAVLLVHIVAPVKHYFIDKVNVWKRMV